MGTYWVRLTTDEPLIVGQAKADSSFLTTITYVPGRLLRGAWADWMIAQGKGDDITGITERTCIWNFFPSGEERQICYTSPFLLSSLTCKREGGFHSEPEPDERGHGVLDALLPELTYALLSERHGPAALPFAPRCTHKGCGDRLEVEKGFFTAYQDGQQIGYARSRSNYHAQTKVALSRQRRAAQENMLYTVTALAPGSQNRGSRRLAFLGRVCGDEESICDLCQAVSIIPIGALRQRGYGKVRAELTNAAGFGALQARLQRFNELVKEMWRDLARLFPKASAKSPEGVYFSLDLLAPGVFQHKGIPSLVPTLAIAGQEIRPIFWLTRSDFASGWSTAWGLPKPTNMAARAGSVYVFHWQGDAASLIPALEELEVRGVGRRCDEGFGECVVCHPFHQEVSER